MWRLVLQGLFRSPLRVGLILGALAVPVALRVSLQSLGAGYERSLRSELESTGLHLMVVPLGCPYDAAARVIKGQALDNTLPDAALAQVRADPAVALAAPLLMTALPRPGEQRVDLWVGLDETARCVKPWWKARLGADWFRSPDGVILGSEAAVIEMRAPGDQLFCPEGNRMFHVDGVLAPSGTSDDHLFFIPLRAAQALFAQPRRLTAIAVRLREPELVREAAQRLQQIPGAQVVTMTETMGVFLNLVGSVRLLLQAISLLAVTVCVLGVFNTMLAAVLERSDELAIMRALGASRGQVLGCVMLESTVLAGAAALVGLALAAVTGHAVENLARPFLPLAPLGAVGRLTGPALLEGLGLGLGAGVLAGLYPAWRASRIQPAQALRPD